MNKQQNNYIVFYSEKCRFCEEFLNELHRNNIDLFRKFVKINVDNRNIKLPKYVTVVPTIIVPANGKDNLLYGDNVFRWLENVSRTRMGQQYGSQPGGSVGGPGGGPGGPGGSGVPGGPLGGPGGMQINNQGGIQDFDPVAMTGFSDSYSLLSDGKNGYSLLESNNTSMQKGFSYIDPKLNASSNLKMNVQDYENVINNQDKIKEGSTNRILDDLKAQRDRDIPTMPQRIGGTSTPSAY